MRVHRKCSKDLSGLLHSNNLCPCYITLAAASACLSWERFTCSIYHHLYYQCTWLLRGLAVYVYKFSENILKNERTHTDGISKKLTNKSGTTPQFFNRLPSLHLSNHTHTPQFPTCHISVLCYVRRGFLYTVTLKWVIEYVCD